MYGSITGGLIGSIQGRVVRPPGMYVKVLFYCLHANKSLLRVEGEGETNTASDAGPRDRFESCERKTTPNYLHY